MVFHSFSSFSGNDISFKKYSKKVYLIFTFCSKIKDFMNAFVKVVSGVSPNNVEKFIV